MPTTTPLVDPALLAKLNALRLSVRQVRWGARMGGPFAINRRGSSVEFADYMAYVPGDDIRAIDWRLYARLDKLFVRTYREEVDLSVEIVVDATASMGLPTAGKFERARQIGYCLAYIALAGRHRVRMSWITPGQVVSSPWYATHGGLAELERLALAREPGGSVTCHEWAQRAVNALRMRGGQVLLVSDWMYRLAECFQALHLLRRRHLDVRLIQVLSDEEWRPARLAQGGVLVDSETGFTHELAYSSAELERAVVMHHERLARFCKQHGIAFALHRLGEPLDELLLRTLPSRRFLE